MSLASGGLTGKSVDISQFRNRRAERVKARYDVEPDSWITLENGEHVPLDANGGVMGGAGGALSGRTFSEANGSKNAFGKGKTDLLMKPKQEWDVDLDDGFEDFQKKNRKNPELRKIYDEEGYEAVRREFYLAKQEKSTKNLHEIEPDEGTYWGEASKMNRTYEKAMDEYVEEVGDSILAGWLRAEDSGYKPAIVSGTLGSEKARNAALNMMYLNYKWGEGDKSFDEFLTTPVKLYRGEHGQKRVGDDVFSAYSFDKDMAQRFAGDKGTIHEIEVRPIDTLGSPRCAGEAEVMVPFWLEEKYRKNDSKYDSVDMFRMRRSGRIAFRTDDEGRWITTENGHHVHLNEEGEPDKGNQHVLSAMNGVSGKVTKESINKG